VKDNKAAKTPENMKMSKTCTNKMDAYYGLKDDSSSTGTNLDYTCKYSFGNPTF